MYELRHPRQAHLHTKSACSSCHHWFCKFSVWTALVLLTDLIKIELRQPRRTEEPRLEVLHCRRCSHRRQHYYSILHVPRDR